jgi:hypothetical protein
VGFALDRLSERLSRGGEHLRAAREDLCVHASALDDAFDALWPDLRAFVAATRVTLLATAGTAPPASASASASRSR